MSQEIPTTELAFSALTTSKESLETKEDPNAMAQPTTIARMFTEANFGKTHTKHNASIPSQHRDLADPVSPQDLNLDTEEPAPSFADANEHKSSVKAAIISKQKRLCSFMPRTINCSDRLTMQKTKAVLYLLPMFLLLSCFFVLITQQHITTIAFLLIITVLLESYIGGWITIIVVLFVLQIVLAIRDAIFWCIVNRWNLEEKKAFIQAYSGVDLMEELDDQERQLDTLRMLYIQQMRANEEMQLIQSSTIHNNNGTSPDEMDPATNEIRDGDNASSSSEMEPQVTMPHGTTVSPPIDVYNPLKSNSVISRNSNAVMAGSNTNTNTVLADSTNTPSMTDDAKAIQQIMDIMNTDHSEPSTSDYTDASNKQHHDQTDTMVVHQTNTPAPGSVTGTNVLKLMNPVTPYTPSVGYVYDNSKYKVTPTNPSNNATVLMAKSQDIPKEPPFKNETHQDQHRDSESVSVATMVKKDSLKIVKPESMTQDTMNGALGRDSQKLGIHMDGQTQEQQLTPSISEDAMTETGSPASPDMDTPVPASIIAAKGDSMLLKTPIIPQSLNAIQDEKPYEMLAEDPSTDALFDEEEDLNTPYDDDDGDEEEQTEEDTLKDLMQNTQPVETPIDPMVDTPYDDMDDVNMNDVDIMIDDSEFNIWGTSPEEKDAFVYITHSCSANMCKHMYRCCPLYKMRLGFALKMSCELCHSLCILFSLFFFFSCVVFVNNNPIYFDVDAISDHTAYMTESYGRTHFETSGLDKDDDIVMGGTETSRDILTGILNYEQTFQYTMDVGSYFTPRSVDDIRDIMIANSNTTADKRKTIRVMGKAKSSSYVLVNNSDILIDLARYPTDDVSIDNNKGRCISSECVAIVTAAASMTIRNLNVFLLQNGYVLHGFGATDDITIGGALGSCSFGPLFNGRSLGYYLVSVSLIDAAGKAHKYDTSDINSEGVRYLDAIRCNLGLLGVIYEVELEVFDVEMVRRVKYEGSDSSSANDSDVIGKELFIDPYSDDFSWIVWETMNSSVSESPFKKNDKYTFDEDVFNTFITPISCVLPITFEVAIDYFMDAGGLYYANANGAPLTYSMNKLQYFVTRAAYLIPHDECLNAIASAKKLANELYDTTVMLPIGVTFITRDENRASLIGYDDMDYCALEIQINACSASRSIFAERFESIVVNEYNGTGHWGHLWYNNDLLYRNREDALNAFESIRSELDPNGVFINALYAHLFPFPSALNPNRNETAFVTESTLMNHVYPRNYSICVYSSYMITGWFGFMFILYLIGSYYRVLPFLDSRNLCQFLCVSSRKDPSSASSSNLNLLANNGNYDYTASSSSGSEGCCNLNCCNDMNELDELIENEQKLLEKYGYEDNYDAVVEDLIDVEVLDPMSNEYITITVTFKTAFFILMDSENNREWKYREAFAVSTSHELNERFDKLGDELAWQSIYPRQCLFFSSCTVSIAMIIIAMVQAVTQ